MHAPAAEPLTRAAAERIGRIARVLVDAALRNVFVRQYIRDLTPWHKCYGLWTVDQVRANPPVRVEFEHAFVLGCVGESLAAARSKPTFGEFVGVLPVEPNGPVGEVRINYVYKDSSPYNRRVNQRKWMKKRLGREWRKLVGKAMYWPKGKFLAGHVTSEARQAIRLKLRLDPGEFWRAARGAVWLDVPKPVVQPTLFDDASEDAA